MSIDHVRISPKGRKLLQNRKLADAVSLALANHHSSFMENGFLKVEGTDITVRLVSSLSDEELVKPKK